MQKHIRSSTYLSATALLFVLFFSAITTVPVLADEGTPPPSSEETGIVPVSTEETATVVVVSTDVPVQLPENTEVIVQDDNGNVLPLASQTAADVLVEGDPIWCPAGVAPKDGLSGCSPAMSGFTTDSIHSTPGGLLGWLNNPANGAAISKAGTIWVAYDYDATGETPLGVAFVISPATTQGTMENFALTIQGGWNGTFGSTALNGATPTSTLNNALSINGWVGAVTINNLTIQNVNNSVTAWDSALEVGTKGNILLNNVTVQNNSNPYDDTVSIAYDRDGIWIYNYGVGGVGTITVNNVRVNNNDGYGLEVFSNRQITLNNVVASGNGFGGNGYTDYVNANYLPCYDGCYSDGILVDNTTSTTNAGIILKGSEQFLNNNGNGLSIFTKGTVNGSNLNAMNNGLHGVYIDNCHYTIIDPLTEDIDCQTTSGLGVTLAGNNTFSNNGADGLRIFSGGAITISNITAISNGLNPNRPHDIDPFSGDLDYGAAGKGVFLDNSGALTAKVVTVSGTNLFTKNASTGLFINSLGAITVSNITADYNGADTLNCDDVFEWATMCKGMLVSGQNNFKLTGYGFFRHNTNDGLAVGTLGTITAANLYAEGNNGNGVVINSKGVTLTGSNFFTNNQGGGLSITSGAAVTLAGSYYSSDNQGIGLEINSVGAIKTNNLTITDNNDIGAHFINNNLVTLPGVTMTGTNIFNNNLYYGLGVETYGTVVTYNITANHNGLDGVYINNCLAPFSSSTGCDAAGRNVTMYGTNTINFNGLNFGYGLAVEASGSITINNLTASSNKEEGVILKACRAADGMFVTLSGYANASNNGSTGMDIVTSGPVTISNISTNSNDGIGTIIDNMLYIESGAYNVTILGYGNFNNNASTGLQVTSAGNILTNNLTANNNTGGGVYLVNHSLNNTATAVTVTMMGNNTFNGNQSTTFAGLLVRTDGAITLNNINANYNNAYGVRLDNVSDAYAGTAFNITIKGVNNFNNNGQDGLYFVATGNVLMTRVTANYNDGLANLYSGSGINGTAGGNITLTCGLTMGNSEGSGYSLTAGIGKIVTLTGVISFGNNLIDVALPTPVIVYNCPLP